MDNGKMMRRKIEAYDFSIWELGLYMDTHPWDTQALQRSQEYQLEREQLVAEYEAKCGPYIINSNQVAGDQWTWIHNPWPWEYSKEG